MSGKAAILGGGPTAVMAALEYARNANPAFVSEIVMIAREGGDKLALGGIGTTSSEFHLLNVLGAKMSADPDPAIANDFVDWAIPAFAADTELSRKVRRALDFYEIPHSVADNFFPRLFHGQYMHEVLLDRARELFAVANEKGIAVSFLTAQGEIASFGAVPGSNDILIRFDENGAKLSDGRTVGSLAVDQIASTYGLQTQRLPEEETLAGVERFTPNIYRPRPGSIFAERDLKGRSADKTVCLLGLGLSAADALGQLAGEGFEGHIIAISPTAALPRRHKDPHVSFPPYKPDFSWDDFRKAADNGRGDISVHRAFTFVEATVAVAESNGHAWQDAVDAFRPHINKMGKELRKTAQSGTDAPALEAMKQIETFWRVVNTKWGDYRHRISWHAGAAIDKHYSDISGGAERDPAKPATIERINGRVKYVSELENGNLQITYGVPRVSGEVTKQIEVNGEVAKCLGFDFRDMVKHTPWKTLADAGMVMPGLGGMGVEVAPLWKKKVHILGQGLVQIEHTGLTEIKPQVREEIPKAAADLKEIIAHKMAPGIEEHRRNGASDEVAKDRAALKLEIGKIYQVYQPHFDRLEEERVDAVRRAEAAEAAGKASSEKRYKNIATSKREEMIEVRAEAEQEVARQLPGLLEKYPHLLDEWEKIPVDPFVPGGYRKVEIFRDEELGLAVQIFVFGPGQETAAYNHPGPCAGAQIEGATANTLLDLVDGKRVPGTITIRYAGEREVDLLGPDVIRQNGEINDTHSLSNPAAGGLPPKPADYHSGKVYNYEELKAILPADYWEKLSVRLHSYDTLRFHGPAIEHSEKGYENTLLVEAGPFVGVRHAFNLPGKVARYSDGNPVDYRVVEGLDAAALPNKTVTVRSGERIPHKTPTGLILHPDGNLKQTKDLADKPEVPRR